jgi:hypothetical protein
MAFVYDIPYFGACGIFPPFHIINQIFLTGGSDGGMGDGAIWEPFEITESEYNELKEAVAKTSVRKLKKLSRYCDFQFEFDSEFDSIPNWLQWMNKTCDKHRLSYQTKMINKYYPRKLRKITLKALNKVNPADR